MMSFVQTAVDGLLQLPHCHEGFVDAARPPSPKTRVHSPKRAPSTEELSPTRTFRLAGIVKRRSTLDSKHVAVARYKCDSDVVEIPLAEDNTLRSLQQQKQTVSRILSDADAGEAYCTWRQQVVRLRLTDHRWVVCRKTHHQKRLAYAKVQLVVTRYTCTQWADPLQVAPCRHCTNRHWRAVCMSPQFLIHIMPLPSHRRDVSGCEEALVDMDGVNVIRDPTMWTTRMPGISAR